MRRLFPLLLLLGCAPSEPEPTPPPAATPPPDAAFVFSFAVIADPHIVADDAHAERTRQTVQWIADHADERSIELALVLGDIGWNNGLQISRDVLDELPIPYVPVLGDNEIQAMDEEAFDDVFGPVIDSLDDAFDDCTRGAIQVHLPDEDHDAWLQNTAFSHRGVRFVALDWNARVFGGLLSEFGDLHDVPGGSLPYLADELAGLGEGQAYDVVLASHIPMHVPAWTQDEMERVGEVTLPVQDRVFANFAGHYHGDGHEVVEQGGYEAIVTDAVWDDVVTVRLVEVWSNGEGFTYVQELHTW